MATRRCVLVARDRFPAWAEDFPLPLSVKSLEDIERLGESPDICVFDTPNPVANVRSLRARHDTCGVVAITSHVEVQESLHLLAAGADEVIFRDSIDHVAVLRAMRSAFERRAVIAQLIETRIERDLREKMAVAAMASKANLLALVNHEVRTPMAVILGHAQTAVSDAHSSDLTKQRLQAIINEVQKLEALIRSKLQVTASSDFGAAENHEGTNGRGTSNGRALSNGSTKPNGKPKPKILIVEDSPDLGQLYTQILSQAGMTVEVQERGFGAIEALRVATCDLLVVDVSLPDIDGFTVSQLARSVGYDGPIICVTANAIPEVQQYAQKIGMAAFLTKPVPSQTLVATVRKHLAQ